MGLESKIKTGIERVDRIFSRSGGSQCQPPSAKAGSLHAQRFMRMFQSVSEQWNPVSGCLHRCLYCWANRLANGRLKPLYLSNRNISQPIIPQPGAPAGYDPYQDPFYPRLWNRRLRRRFKAGILVFVVDMGDLFGDWVSTDWILAVIDLIKRFPQTDFLFLTKNPERYKEFVFPPNAVLGVTLESDEDYDVTKAPPPMLRFKAMIEVSHPRKFVSIEPIMDFDLDSLSSWVFGIGPELVEVGADNHGFHLPEPSWDKVEKLLKQLRTFCPRVIEKDGLRRLKDG